MAFAAIRYEIKDGFRDEITKIFGEFRRVDDPVVRDGSGAQVGRILATAVFLEGPTMVRVIQYEGDLEQIARYMAVQPGVRQVERDLAPYLARPRHTSTPDDFVETFRNSLMRCISHLPPPGAG